MLLAEKEYFDRRDLEGGVHHYTKQIDKIEDIHVGMTELVLRQTGVITNKVYSRKEGNMAELLENKISK